jgi:hypothetical protein
MVPGTVAQKDLEAAKGSGTVSLAIADFPALMREGTHHLP